MSRPRCSRRFATCAVAVVIVVLVTAPFWWVDYFAGGPPLHGSERETPLFATRDPLTPRFPVTGVAQTADGRRALFVDVPMYVTVTTGTASAMRLMLLASQVSGRDIRVLEEYPEAAGFRIRTVLVDNTGCDWGVRIQRPQRVAFESHAEVTAGVDCAAWQRWTANATALELKFHAERLVMPSSLPFGAQQNYILQDAARRHRVPRFLWAHDDIRIVERHHVENRTAEPLEARSAPPSPGVLEQMAGATLLLRTPFCVALTVHDTLSAFDAFSVQREVGEWDPYLWYYGDDDFYQRCSLAQLPLVTLPSLAARVEHANSMTLKSAVSNGAKQQDRLRELRLPMFVQYFQRKQALFGAFGPPPASATVEVQWESLAAVVSHKYLQRTAVALSEAIGTVVWPWKVALDCDVRRPAAGSLAGRGCCDGVTAVFTTRTQEPTTASLRTMFFGSNSADSRKAALWASDVVMDAALTRSGTHVSQWSRPNPPPASKWWVGGVVGVAVLLSVVAAVVRHRVARA